MSGVVYSQTGMAAFTSGTDGENGVVQYVHLNKGGTTANTRQDLELSVHLSSPAQTPFDVTKTYSVTITEE